MQDRLEEQPLKDIVGDDERLAQALAAFVPLLDRFSEQLERKDAVLEKKEEIIRGLDHETVHLRSTNAKLQRLYDETRRTFNAAQIERQRSIDVLCEKVKALQAICDNAQSLEEMRIVRWNRLEADRTRAQISEVDAMIAAIQRSFFWRIKLRLATLRSPLRSFVRAAVRR